MATVSNTNKKVSRKRTPIQILYDIINRMWKDKIPYLRGSADRAIATIRSLSDKQLGDGIGRHRPTVLRIAIVNLHRIDRLQQNGLHVLRVVFELLARVPIDGGLCGDGLTIFPSSPDDATDVLLRFEQMQNIASTGNLKFIVDIHHDVLWRARDYALRIRPTIVRVLGQFLEMASRSSHLAASLSNLVAEYILPFDRSDAYELYRSHQCGRHSLFDDARFDFRTAPFLACHRCDAHTTPCHFDDLCRSTLAFPCNPHAQTIAPIAPPDPNTRQSRLRRLMVARRARLHRSRSTPPRFISSLS